MMKSSKTKVGMIITGIYLIISLVAFLTHIISVNVNAGDTGLSAVWFYLCSLPWMGWIMSLIPSHIFYTTLWGRIVYPVGWLCVLLNALILYGLCGGLRSNPKKG